MPEGARCEIGLVGCGRWGKLILRDLVALGCEVWVVARDSNSRENIAAHKVAGVVASVSELPQHLAGYVVATTTASHYEVIEQLGPRGKPIYCEKPLCHDVAQAETIVQHWGDLVFVMDKWRYHPAIEQLRDWVASGKFGRLESIRTRRMQWASPHTDVDAPWILLPHDLSIVRHILGKLPPIKFCFGQHKNGTVHSVTALLSDSLPSGPSQRNSVDCLLEVSTYSPVTHRRIELYGERGSALLDDSNYAQLLWNDEQDFGFANPPKIFQLSESMPLEAELAAFVDYVHSGTDAPLTSAAQGLQSVQYIAQMIKDIQCRSLP